MPAALDLIGARFGQLTVIDRAGGNGKNRLWLCRCNCGAILSVLQRRLTTSSPSHQQHACDSCRARACEICGGMVSASSAAATCSTECHAERLRRYQLAWYYKRRADDPAARAARSERARFAWANLSPEERLELSRKRRLSEDPEIVRSRNRAAHARRMEDPTYAEARAAKQAKWQAEHPEKTRLYSLKYKRRLAAVKTARELGDAARQLQETKDHDPQN